MGKRSGNKASEDIRVEPGVLVDTYETAAAAVGIGPPGAVPPSIEERLERLEKELAEKDRIICKQSCAIALGTVNAERLRKSRDRVKLAEDEAEAAKKASSEAKKAYESAVNEHFELERDLDSPQQWLPFPALPDEPEPGTTGRHNPEPWADEAWRGVILGTLDLSNSTVAKLHEANLTTVGDLSDYLRPSETGYCRKLQDIDGIGAAKAEEIANALEAFWTAQASPVTFPTSDANAEILAGVQEAEAEREGKTVGFVPTVDVDVAMDSWGDEDGDNDDSVDDDIAMSEVQETSWRRDAGSV